MSPVFVRCAKNRNSRRRKARHGLWYATSPGVTLQAAIMLGKAGPALDDVLVLRVLASSLGIRQISGQVAFLLPRNATIPTKREASDGRHAPMQLVNIGMLMLCSGLLMVTRHIAGPPVPSCATACPLYAQAFAV